jgi:hypothetical protein
MGCICPRARSNRKDRVRKASMVESFRKSDRRKDAFRDTLWVLEFRILAPVAAAFFNNLVTVS